MDSMSSGHSSGDHVLAPIPNSSSNAESMKRSGRTGKPIVMPLEDLSDQDETPVYLRYAPVEMWKIKIAIPVQYKKNLKIYVIMGTERGNEMQMKFTVCWSSKCLPCKPSAPWPAFVIWLSTVVSVLLSVYNSGLNT
jgi:hypothetical protein